MCMVLHLSVLNMYMYVSNTKKICILLPCEMDSETSGEKIHITWKTIQDALSRILCLQVRQSC